MSFPHRNPTILDSSSILTPPSTARSDYHSTTPLSPSRPSRRRDLTSNNDGQLMDKLSVSEKLLITRATAVGTRVREWLGQLEEWDWSGRFEPSGSTSRRKNGYGLQEEDERGEEGGGGEEEEEEEEEEGEVWGSLTASEVRRRESALDTMRTELDDLDVNELKQHVRAAHAGVREASSSSKLDDFTIAMTTTVMEALPELARLESVLNIWRIRLTVLRMVPGYLEQLSAAFLAVEAAWNTIGLDLASGLTKQTCETMKDVLQDRVVKLGTRLDAMLDALEGREDRLPDSWIDDMEAVQRDYEDWVVSSERIVSENEMRREKALRSSDGNLTEDVEEDARVQMATQVTMMNSGADLPISGSIATLAVSRPEGTDSESFDGIQTDTTPTRTTPQMESHLNPPKLSVLSAGQKSDKSLDEQINERITSLLEDVPIQLASSMDVTTPGSPRTPTRHIDTSSPDSPIILAPAPPATKSKTNTESNVRVYHLTQPGRDVPMKLFVRLVGEHGERVMVRVGGGWADLGEYLRDFALHHGRSTTLDQKFEIKGLPTAQAAAAASTAPFLSNGRTTPMSRPETPTMPSLGVRKTRRTSGAAANPYNTPDMPVKFFNATPQSASSVNSTRSVSSPAWSEENNSSLGMAGPRSKKQLDVSPNKQAWVNGMIEQARQVSTESKRAVSGETAGSGTKDSGIRRVFMKKKA